MHDRLSFRRKVISVFDMCIMLFDMNIAFILTLLTALMVLMTVTAADRPSA